MNVLDQKPYHDTKERYRWKHNIMIHPGSAHTRPLQRLPPRRWIGGAFVRGAFADDMVAFVYFIVVVFVVFVVPVPAPVTATVVVRVAVVIMCLSTFANGPA